MNKETKFTPTRHAIERLRERFHPHISDDRAREILESLAKDAKPLKVTVRA